MTYTKNSDIFQMKQIKMELNYQYYKSINCNNMNSIKEQDRLINS